MSVPISRTALLQAIDKEFAALHRRLATIRPDQAYTACMPGHAKDSVISVADLVAYLLGWGNLVLKWHKREQQGLPIDFPETGYKWNQLGELAQKFYQDYADVPSWEALLNLLETNHQQIIQLVESHSDESLYGCTWYSKWPRGRMIQFNTASPYKNAAGRIRAWQKTACSC